MAKKMLYRKGAGGGETIDNEGELSHGRV